MGAPFRLADAEGLFFPIVGRRQMVDTGEKRTELLAVIYDAADGNTAEADAVVAAFAADQSHPRGITPDIVIGQRNLERSTGRCRAGVAEKHVMEIARR